MPKVHEGQLDAKGRTFGIVVSRFNDLVTTRLLDGALDCIKRHGGDDDNIEVAWVPGAFELPIAAQKLATTGRFDVVMCLGAIVRSETPHFDYVAGESAKGIARVGLDTGVPVIFGVITADTVDQAVQRAGIKAGNRGWDAAMNAVEMASLMASWDNDRRG
ncbi:MAG: 6,7-dimethyl-8-ribityllumazine synthase [Gemmatimonadetes bacterium]|jgi:6,7-dimethyl-8-ribityllumazine synthase|nr:6,7-dimethyl-8-ribityllumazine synthase [Gemmatimonadota bacterium]MBT5325087.1 6,7-dimethyl-8-ribityllumazine synthase [Gemmatimonadota bacterium]MBT5452492.1 6,7-dimethyl-8-ribityllumazine synthase [Gemmatimonadota bacterium]MBT5804392.1 6,7-dimethyl-8-ribityllumazine synthase [Gemmatimonadota bacterium]MBT6905907.1 6,7-dimethyl-8-ribityllumazine synthase [Gemmatimonadota bacterium]